MSGRQLRNRLVPSTPSSSTSTSGVVSGRQLRSRVVPVPLTPPQASGCGPGVQHKNGSQSARSTAAPKSCVSRTRNSRAQRPESLRIQSTRSARMSVGVSLRSSVLGQKIPTGNQRNIKSAAVEVQKRQDVLNIPKKQESQKSPPPADALFNCSGVLFSCDGNSHQCTLCFCPCPLANDGNCQWEGSLNEVADHIVRTHCPVEKTTGPNVYIKLNNWRRPNPTHWVTFQTCLGQHFLTAVERVEVKNCSLFLGTVRVLGQQDVADRFEFRMTLKTTSRTFSYSTIVKPIHDKTAVSKRDCFVFDSSLAEIFSQEESLEIAVSISVMKM